MSGEELTITNQTHYLKFLLAGAVYDQGTSIERRLVRNLPPDMGGMLSPLTNVPWSQTERHSDQGKYVEELTT